MGATKDKAEHYATSRIDALADKAAWKAGLYGAAVGGTLAVIGLLSEHSLFYPYPPKNPGIFIAGMAALGATITGGIFYYSAYRDIRETGHVQTYNVLGFPEKAKEKIIEKTESIAPDLTKDTHVKELIAKRLHKHEKQDERSK